MYHIKEGEERNINHEFLVDLDELISSFIKATKFTQQKLETYYRMTYNTGDIRQKLSILLQDELEPEVDELLNNLFKKYTEETFRNLDSYDRFVHFLSAAPITLCFNERIQLMDFTEQRSMAEKCLTVPKSYCTVTFNKVQKQLSGFKIHFEQLYDYFRKIIYLSKHNFATSYFDFDTTQCTVLNANLAQDINFNHSLQSLSGNDLLKYKIIFKGNSDAIKPIGNIFHLLIPNVDSTSLEEMIKEPDLYFPFPMKQLHAAPLYKKGRENLQEEFFTILNRINNTYIQNEQIIQVPLIEEIREEEQ
ncbi:hypothetical protein GO495_06580 [Chitinophaga oryziterrae]|uniref:Uncharacterized protein n=1 Tax=Chitinophaga oryziterrae TaxID=1031224 RepID=A0A6N8J4Y9_9BACT|nr:hypothetical protein [Chitinophaga oryziterrae]MVT40240.1 hypothetical protein [Chitinophaga oryziterrae]